jgi:hypothetical protein
LPLSIAPDPSRGLSALQLGADMHRIGGVVVDVFEAWIQAGEFGLEMLSRRCQ